jgi:hypothetical protein
VELGKIIEAIGYMQEAAEYAGKFRDELPVS